MIVIISQVGGPWIIFFSQIQVWCTEFPKMIFLLLFNYSCPHFPPLLSPALPTPHLLLSIPPCPRCLCPWVFYTCSFTWPFPFFSPLSPIPSGHCQFVLYFNVSVSILLTCLFCWLGPTYRWDHMVFVFYHLAYFTSHKALRFHPCCWEG